MRYLILALLVCTLLGGCGGGNAVDEFRAAPAADQSDPFGDPPPPPAAPKR